MTLANPVRPETRVAAQAQNPLPIAGFESTDYATLNGRVVWIGEQAGADHPRNLWRPWQAEPFTGNPARMQRGALTGLALLQGPVQPGLLSWLKPGLSTDPWPFWLKQASPRFDALALALGTNDLPALEQAALRLLGLGPGLTPSGDDFVGAVFFTLQHAPRTHWAAELPAVLDRIRTAARGATNRISAALLSDLLDGQSFRALHDLMLALDSEDPILIDAAAQALMNIGASSGCDMLCGALLALSTWQESF